MTIAVAKSIPSQRPLDLESLPVFTPDPAVLSDQLIVGLDSRDSRSRAFNLLRTTLAKRMKEKGHRLVGITSATPSAGKSFLSLNLAASLSRVSEDDVILVDLDLRRASIAEGVGMQVKRGVSEFLNGEVSELASIGSRVHDSQLVLFPTKAVSKNTAELISGPVFEKFISGLRQETGNSIILFDLPPAFANDDAMLILGQLDAYVMVIDSGKTNTKQVQDVLAMLDPVPCIGTVLNRYNGGFADNYGYGYGTSAYAKYYD
ncbi:CpsD/CapB family tyrosine-protein kinase [Sphingorhabdus sp.]|uniref:CpsD/CapB family tyrosine-protein kinase n=1 Tax=Sphingorhabdus sp. TaxID=1902408 RepID=UPI0039199E35